MTRDERDAAILAMHHAEERPSMIANKLGVSYETIRRSARRLGLTFKTGAPRKYHRNEQFFDAIDTEQKAYVLGLFMADGYNDTKKGIIRLKLQERDKAILEQVKSMLGYTGKLYKHTYNKPNQQDQYALQIRSKYLSDRLAELGVIPYRRLAMSFPTNLPQDLIPHYIRGFFDGNGSVYNSRVSISGNIGFIEELQNLLITELGISKTKIALQNKACGNMHLYKLKDIDALAEYLYKDTTIWLKRKRDKFDECFPITEEESNTPTIGTLVC